MIIDFRVKPPYKGFRDFYVFQRRPEFPDPVKRPALATGRPPMPSVDERSWDLFLREMAEAKIDMAVIQGGQFSPTFGWMSNDEIAEMTRDHPTKFVAFAGIDPSQPVNAVREVTRTITELGFKGIAMNPAWAPTPLYPDDPRIDPVYETCQRLGGLRHHGQHLYGTRPHAQRPDPHSAGGPQVSRFQTRRRPRVLAALPHDARRGDAVPQRVPRT